MAYQPLAGIERKDGGMGASVLPAGAYSCVILDARVNRSKAKGTLQVMITYDIAEGEHKGHFGSSEFGNSTWLGLEDGSSSYTAAKLDKLSASNSVPPVTFDAVAAVDAAVMAYLASGVGEMPIDQFTGKVIGFVIGVEVENYKGEQRERNFVDRWVTPYEVKTGRFTDSKGVEHDIRVPNKRNKAAQQTPQQTPPQAVEQQPTAYTDEYISF